MSKFIDKINVPSEINENEGKLYHVIIVEASFNQAKLEADYKARVQMYDDRSWLAVKDRLKQIGHTNVYVIHDPTIKAEAKKPKAPKTPKTPKGDKKGKDAGANAGAGADAGAGDDKETPKEKRDRLITEAKALGYEGALNAKNSTFEEFIKNAKTNGANAGAGDEEE